MLSLSTKVATAVFKLTEDPRPCWQQITSPNSFTSKTQVGIYVICFSFVSHYVARRPSAELVRTGKWEPFLSSHQRNVENTSWKMHTGTLLLLFRYTRGTRHHTFPRNRLFSKDYFYLSQGFFWFILEQWSQLLVPLSNTWVKSEHILIRIVYTSS